MSALPPDVVFGPHVECASRADGKASSDGRAFATEGRRLTSGTSEGPFVAIVTEREIANKRRAEGGRTGFAWTEGARASAVRKSAAFAG